MTAATPRLTAARRRALEVLLEGERTGRTVRESNHTTGPSETVWCTRKGCGEMLGRRTDPERWAHEFVADTHPASPQPLTIYHQAREWLEARGYLTSRVSVTADASGRICRLTAAGRRVAQEAGIR